jgi:hypothetical protein
VCLSHLTCEACGVGPWLGSLLDCEPLGPKLGALRANFGLTAFSEVHEGLDGYLCRRSSATFLQRTTGCQEGAPPPSPMLFMFSPSASIVTKPLQLSKKTIFFPSGDHSGEPGS